MKTIIKILKFGPDHKICSVCFAVLLVVALIPLFLLTKYAIPFFDDYGYSAPVWIHYMLGGFNPKGVISGALLNCISMWHHWQGTYSSIFLMGLNPMVFGEQYYVIGPVFLIANLVLSLFIFIYVSIKYGLKESGIIILGIQSSVTLMAVLFVYSAQQAFFWFNGGVHYVGMFSFELYFLSVLILLAKINENQKISKKRIPVTILLVFISIFLGFFVAGANFVTTLQTMILILSGVVLALFHKNKRILLWIPSVLAFSVGFFLNLSAPGNAVRAANYPDTPGAFESILKSFPLSFRFIGRFTDWRTLFLLILILPLLWYLTGRIYQRNPKAFSVPGFIILALWSYCVYAASFTPGLYGMGEVVLSRMINIIKLTFQLLLILNCAYVLGLIRSIIIKTTGKKDSVNTNSSENISLVLILLCLAGSVFFFIKSPDKTGQYSTYGAYHYLADGEAKLFHVQYENRVRRLKTPETDVVLEPYSIRPWFLIWTDLSTDPNAPENLELAYYYGKSSVSLKSE